MYLSAYYVAFKCYAKPLYYSQVPLSVGFDRLKVYMRMYVRVCVCVCACAVIQTAVIKDLNKQSIWRKQQWKKDESKRRREQAATPASAWTCELSGCSFTAQNKAGLMIPSVAKTCMHGPNSTARVPCQNCGHLFIHIESVTTTEHVNKTVEHFSCTNVC
jgi:hypothetical protein